MQPKQPDNHDPLETCDVTPAYTSLNLENESRTLENLNKAVSCWSSALQNVSLVMYWTYRHETDTACLGCETKQSLL
jgi:hypothetical protein